MLAEDARAGSHSPRLQRGPAESLAFVHVWVKKVDKSGALSAAEREKQTTGRGPDADPDARGWHKAQCSGMSG